MHPAPTAADLQKGESLQPLWAANCHSLENCLFLIKMPCHKKHVKGHKKGTCGKRKKVIRKDGKRYYRAGKSGLVRLKGGKKPPRRRR